MASIDMPYVWGIKWSSPLPANVPTAKPTIHVKILWGVGGMRIECVGALDKLGIIRSSPFPVKVPTTKLAS